MRLQIEDVKYLFTLEGYAWGHTNEIYVVTVDDKLYYSPVNNMLDSEFEFVGDLYGEHISNRVISTTYSWEAGEQKKEHRYLYDLLDENGRVNFEEFKENTNAIMDADDVGLYKNVDNQLVLLIKQSYSSRNMPALEYAIIAKSLYRQKGNEK